MKNAQPDWLNKELYPFASRFVEIEGNHIHYIDEGSGETILFLHGTPEWSFGYRDLVRKLKKSFRCIAPDMLGFGLSDKPSNGDYSCPAHARRLEILITKLGLKNITLVANDFGGGIGLSYFINHPENVQRIILFNTWMWSLKSDSHFSGPARFMNTYLGKILYLTFNLPVNVIMPAAFGNKKLLTSEIHKHYKKALPPGNRTAAYQFAKELMAASDWWQSLWEHVEVIQNKPFLFFWGMKDKFVPATVLEKWQSRFPSAKVIQFPDAGHFVQEEKPEEMARAIRHFISYPVEA